MIDSSNPAETIQDIYIPLFSAPSGMERIKILFHQLQHVAHSNYYTSYGVRYMLTSLLIELSQQAISGFHVSKTRTKGDMNIAKVAEWTRIHAMTDISVAEIASKFKYSKEHLSRSFKQKTGINLLEYIHRLKIAKAKDLLARSSQNVKEISGMVGIHDEKYFSKLFRKYENMTPTEFRKAYYETHMNNK